ncbi:MAG: leukotoxin LktA family filamentous adhesin [Alphaproteobacteria bacterium]|nr:leukotoxin LktA family filamentous adhesin [Alphaproteobacteria bacterium]
MKQKAILRKNQQTSKSQEIVFKEPSVFRKIVSFITAYSMLFLNITPVFAQTNITGVQGNNGVYDIDAAKVSGSTGFRQYTDFTLDNGDVANLKFDQGYDKFVNLVDNQVNINGILNTIKNNAFYNGHAIFVSPNGIVVGASGVLNVGSLTMATPSADKYNSFKNGYEADLGNHIFGSDKYNELINDSHGNITINGKIMAKENVELYGDNITIKGSQNNKAGIVAGVKNQNKITTQQQAKQVFDSLVQNNIKDADNFNLEGGKIKIVAGFKDYTLKDGKPDKPNGTSNKAEVNVDDANLGANEVEIKANTIRDAYVYATADEAISSTIDITRSDITAENIDILANSEDYYGRNVNLTVPAIYLWIFDADDHDAHISDFFTETVYNGFEGVRTTATVDVKDAVLQAIEDISIEATTSSKTGISTDILGQFIPSIIYGYGTKTVTQINIENSVLNAGGDIDLNANSENILKTKIWDDIAAGLTLRVTDAFNLILMKNSASADTKVVIDHSTLEAENVSAQATAYNEMDNEAVLQERIGKNDFMSEVNNKGGSAISLGGIINVSDIKSAVEVKNDSKIIATKDVDLKAWNVNDISNWMDAEIKDVEDYTNQKPFKEGTNWFSKRLNDIGALAGMWDKISTFTLKDFATKFQQKGKNIYDIAHPEQKQKMENATMQAGLAAVWNNVSTTNNVKIDNSTISAKNIEIRAHTIDNTINEADGYADETANWGGALGMVVNKQHNDNSVDILNASKLTAAEDIDVTSVVELPAQQGSLGLSATVFGHPINFAVDFGFNADDEWEFGFHDVTNSPLADTLMPKAGVFGFYNNFATGSSAGEKASASGAIIYSELKNNSDINITNSTLTANTGDVVMNAIVSASAHDAADFFNYDGLIDEIKTLAGGDFNKYNQESGSGLGAAVIVQNFTNNAGVTIDNSKITAKEGDVTLNAAAEQSYLTILTPGGKAESFGLDGAVNIQEIFGTTAVTVKNGTEIKADNISIDAGKANNVLSKKGTHMADTSEEFISTNGDVILDYYTVEEDNGGLLPNIVIYQKYRDIKDHITSVVINGSYTKQSEETTEQSSSGAAVGASVSVQEIERAVKADILNSKLVADSNLSVKSDSRMKNIFVTLAGAFAGGVEKPNDTGANNGGLGNVQRNAENAQDKEDDADLLEALLYDDDGLLNDMLGNGDGDDVNPLENMRSSFSLSVAGTVVVLNDQTDISSTVANSELKVGKDLDVTADRDSHLLTISGGLAKSNQYGAGASVNVYKQAGSVKASILDNTKIIFAAEDVNPKFNVKAHNDNSLINIAVGVAAAGDPGDTQNVNFKAAVGGSVNVNTLKPEITASIENSTVKVEEDGKDIDATVKAENEVDSYNIAGGGSYINGGSNAIGAGVALNYNNVKNDVQAYVANSILNNINTLSVLSSSDNDMNDFAVAGSLVRGDDTSGWVFDGSIDINYIHDTVKSRIIGSTITANDDVEVKADAKDDSLAAAGTLNISTANSGVGVNGDVIVNVIRNNVLAEIGDSYQIINLKPVVDRNSDILSAKDVKVAATSTEKVNDILAGIAVSTKGTYLMAAANVNVNSIENDVKSYVSGNIGTGENSKAISGLNVAAYDETTIYSRGGTVSASTSNEATSVVAGSVNVDKLAKTVEAKIFNADVKATGNVTASAASVNSMGGTKGDDNKYSSDDVTSDAYRDKLLHKDAEDRYDGLNMKDGVSLDQDSDFANWNMFFDIAGGANIAVAGAGIGKVIENTITAEIANSKIEADKLYVLADDYSIKNIIAGTISGSFKGSSGLSVLYAKDKSVTSALVGKGSELNIVNNLIIDAANRKDNHQILIAGSGAMKGSINANIAINDIEDEVYAKIDNETTAKDIKAGNISINANEDINASHIVVSGGGASNLVLDVNPIVNTYNATVVSAIKNSKVKDASIAINAQTTMDSLDVSAGVAGVAKGIAGVGVAIKNDYIGNIKSYIDNAVINTEKDIDIDASSVINANNWVVGGSAAGQGVSVTLNVLWNNVNSTLEAGIENSTIEKADAITINTNKDKTDHIDNTAIAAALAGQGASAIVNVIKNDFTNTATSYVENTGSTEIGSLEVESNSDRRTNNINFGLIITGEGAGLAANALSNDINSTTRSYIDAKSKTLNVERNLDVKSNDTAAARNSVVMGSLVALGGGVGLNINLYSANNLVKSEILSATAGQINAGSVNMNSELTNAMDNTQVDLSLGLATAPIDVQVIKIGQKTNTYSQAEIISDVNKYLNTMFSMIPQGLSTSTTPSNNLQAGAISSISGNIKTVLDTNINAKSHVKGLTKQDGKDVLTNELDLNSFTLVGGLGSASVGVRDVQIANNTVAEIKGGKVESTDGDVSISAQSEANVKMTNTSAEISGLQISGGSDIYENSSETLAQIKDSEVNAQSIGINSKSKSHAKIDTTHVAGSIGSAVNVDLVEAKDTNKTISLITGNTNINANDKLTIHSTVDTDLQSLKLSVPIAGASLVSVLKNDATANTISKAIIEDVNGTINTNGLEIVTDYDDMSVTARSNIVSVKAISVAEYNDSGAFMNAYFKSGIDSIDGLILKNTGTTQITTAKANSQKDVLAYGRTHDVSVQGIGIYTGTFANAKTNATSATVLKVKDHTSDKLNINQYLNSKAKADANGTKVTAAGVYAVAAEATDESKMTLDIGGTNTVLGRANIIATHNATSEADLKAFNLGLLVSGSRLRLNSDMEADTIANIGGNFNVLGTIADIEIITTRNAKLDKTSGTGGFINVADTGVANVLKGQSVLNLSALKTNAENKNRMAILNRSVNNYNIKTTDGSGGFINVADSSATSSFNTTTETNIENSDINSSSDFNVTTDDSTQIEDDASAAGGGFISYVNGSINNNYLSNAKINIKNSNIKAQNMKLMATAGVGAYPKDAHYTGDAGGVVAFDYIDVNNTITSTSEINIQNSILEATHNAIFDVSSNNYFKQKIESGAYGLKSKASGVSHLNVTNNNKITIDNKSKLSARNELEIDFNSSNNLTSRVVSDVTNFSGEPVAKSYLDLTINNTLENSGTIYAGNLLDINFMLGSNNILTQFAQSVSTAAIASTTEDGKLTRKINNKIDNKANAEMTSGKDVDINYTSGQGETNSVIYWVTKSAWGAITNSGQSSKRELYNGYSLINNGKITAAQNNAKYMKINRDGTVDQTTLRSFYDTDYILSDDEVINGAKLKEQKLADIDIELENANGTIQEYEDTIANYNTIMANLNEQKAEAEAAIGELTTLIENGAVLLESKAGGSGIYAEISAFDLKMQKDMGCVRYTNNDPGYASKITLDEYNTMMQDYAKELSNDENLTISEFLNTKNYGFSDAQKTNIVNGYNDVKSRLSTTAHGFAQYIGKDGITYIAALNPTGEGAAQSCKNMVDLNNTIADIENQIQSAQNIKDNGIALLEELNSERTALITEYNDIYETPDSEYDYNGNYSIVFKDIIINPDSGKINIHGLTNDGISGNGTVEIAKAGLQIDNYSTRSLVFNDVVVNETSSGGSFVVNDKSMSEFADKNQAISGQKAYEYLYGNSSWWNLNDERPSFDSLPTSGVHYVTNDTGIIGTTINNYYDNNHPLADTFDIPNPTVASDITINGDINTGSLSISNESGNIAIQSGDMNTGSMNLYAMNGEVNITAHNDANNAKFNLNSGGQIFAADGVNITADEVDIKSGSNIKTGYSLRGITITDEMLKEENLIIDPTTGEKNLINLGGNQLSPDLNDGVVKGNIKAIYQDGQIYVYDLPELKTDNGVKIVASTGTVKGITTVSTGSQAIEINNKTNKTLVTGDIVNTAVDGQYSVQGGATSAANLTTQEVINTKIDISSNGKAVINGKIVNGIDGQSGEPLENGKLSINAKNGVDIAKHQTYDSITAGGSVDIVNNGSGTLNVYGDITNKKGNTNMYGSNGVSVYGKVHNIDGDVVMTAPKGNLTLARGSQVHVDKGDLKLNQHDLHGSLIMNGQVILRDGNLMTDSFGNETDNGLVFGKEFMAENDLGNLLALNFNEPEIDYVLNNNMGYGYDVTKDKDLKSSVKILRLHKDGATIVNENNWKAGDKMELSIEFEGVNIMAQCKVVKVENGVAQIRFLNLPRSIANKITERYMNKGLFHQWVSN